VAAVGRAYKHETGEAPMPKKTLDDIVKERKALVKELGDYEKDKNQIDSRMKKVQTDYDTIRDGLEEGLKEINELKTQLKSAFSTWEKMFGKLDTIKGNFAEIAKIAKATTPNVEKFNDEATGLSKALAGCGGDMKDIKDEEGELKKIKQNAERLLFDFNNLYQSAAPPKDPVKPTLAVA
jgi:chromosome segregation ATPase